MTRDRIKAEAAMNKVDWDSNCRHHWVIDQAAGPTSQGRCKVCGIEKSFLTVYEDVQSEIEGRKEMRGLHLVAKA